MFADSPGNLPKRNSVQQSELDCNATLEVGEPFQAALEQLEEWYDSWRPKPNRETARYVVCVGLAVLHRMREAWPISRDLYISGLDVRTSGALIRNILAEYGIHRMYASAGGRTSGPAILAAEALVSRMNAVAGNWNLDAREREQIIDKLQAWLVKKVEHYFETHPISDVPRRQF